MRTPDLDESGVGATLAWLDEPAHGVGSGAAGLPESGSSPAQPAVRLGLGSVRSLGDDRAERIVAERDEHGPYASMEDLQRRVPGLTLPILEALATAGAFGGLVDSAGTPLDRRRALWAAGAVAQGGADRLAGVVTGADAPTLPGLSPQEESGADLWATGVAPDGHPTRFVRGELDDLGVVTAAGLQAVEPGSKVLVGGVVTHRQRPATAGGTTFINLEDETGLINVVVSRGCWLRHRRVARSAPALLIRGRLERSEGVTNVIAEKLRPLPVAAGSMSRDFR